jgi:hypothetical protein
MTRGRGRYSRDVAARLGLAAALAVSLGSAAQARPFYVIHTAPGAMTLLDPASLQTLGGGVVRRATTITVQRSLTAEGPPQPGYVRTLVDHDCERGQARWVKLSVFSREGVLLVEETNSRSGWSAPAANTETLASLRYACGQGGGYSVISAESIGHVVSAVMQGWSAPKLESPLDSASRPRAKPR